MFTGYHRVSPGITGYHRVSLDPVGFAPVPGACGAQILNVAAGGGGPRLAPPPAHAFQPAANRLASCLVHCLALCLQQCIQCLQWL
jgi:hypothetical protein